MTRGSRGGVAVRLTYDHKGSDQQEAQRIMAAGGFVMNNRVNGTLDALLFGIQTHKAYQRVACRCSGCHAVAGRFIHERVCRGLALYNRDNTG